jgi:hypothetical protein
MSVVRREDSIKAIQEKNVSDEAEKAALMQQITDLQLALCEVYELVIGGGA